MIERCTCPTDRCHLTLTSYSWFSGQNYVFWVLVFYSDTICNRSTLFGVGKYFMMNMSVSQVLFDHDLIFMVQWSKLSFWVLVFYYNTICNMATIFVVWKDYKLHSTFSLRYSLFVLMRRKQFTNQLINHRTLSMFLILVRFKVVTYDVIKQNKNETS